MGKDFDFFDWLVYFHVHIFALYLYIMYIFVGCEISDDEAEKIFTVNDAVELLKKKMDIEE